MTGSVAIEHIAARPSWDCAACGQTWPCANAKVDLLQEFRDHTTALAVYLAGCMHDAACDLTAHGEPTPADLYSRFLGWISQRRPEQPPIVRPAPQAGHGPTSSGPKLHNKP